MRHIRTHTGEKIFACEVSVESFAVKSTFRTHIDSGMLEEVEPDEIAIPDPPVEAHEAPFFQLLHETLV